MLLPRCKITFLKYSNYTGEKEFYSGVGDRYIIDFVTEIEIVESLLELTQTFKLKFPRALNFQGNALFNGSKPIFQRGDHVTVELGYYPKSRVVFRGWISDISAKIPVELTCEDDMFLLKNTVVSYPDKANINKVYKSLKNGKASKRSKLISPEITLNQLLTNILPEDIDTTDETKRLNINLGMFRATRVSVTKILETLQDKYGLFSTFIDGKLNVGFQSDASRTNIIPFQFEHNIIDDSNLEFKRAEDTIIKVVVISIDLNDVKTEVEVGDPDGAQRTYHMFNADKASMEQFANAKLTEVKYTGYVGSFTTFGEPYVRAGDVVKLTSTKLPERDGNYIVATVKRSFGINGYRQDVEVLNKQ